MIVRHFTEQLIVDQSLDCHLIERNLYKVFLSICDDKRITEKAVQMEEKKGKEFLFHNLQKFANNKSFVEKMQYEPHEPGDVLLLTGVGEVFPFMRIHSLLEALQPEFPDIPILVMYPEHMTEDLCVCSISWNRIHITAHLILLELMVPIIMYCRRY